MYIGQCGSCWRTPGSRGCASRGGRGGGGCVVGFSSARFRVLPLLLLLTLLLLFFLLPLPDIAQRCLDRPLELLVLALTLDLQWGTLSCLLLLWGMAADIVANETIPRALGLLQHHRGGSFQGAFGALPGGGSFLTGDCEDSLRSQSGSLQACQVALHRELGRGRPRHRGHAPAARRQLLRANTHALDLVGQHAHVFVGHLPQLRTTNAAQDLQRVAQSRHPAERLHGIRAVHQLVADRKGPKLNSGVGIAESEYQRPDSLSDLPRCVL
mmetsp:Transcript_26027/g.74513  ORF Transcript_26027/g.74513 Transcript_26027/m.74513 type:complete len:269 (-) Transcript_26027:276-1082(-)